MMTIGGRSVLHRQKRFLRLLEPIERWPALPILVLCIFRRARHRVETVWQVEALDAAPFAIGQLAQENLDHAVEKVGTRRLG